MDFKNYFLPGNERKLKIFFDKQRRERMPMLKRICRGSTSDAEEVFDDAVLVLYNTIKENKLPANMSVEGYLCGICRNQALKRLQKDKHTFEMFAPPRHDFGRLKVFEEYDDNHEDNYQELYEKVQALPEPCNTILWSFYWSRMPYDEIATEMGYKSVDVAKTKKSQCLTKLRNSYGITRRQRRK